MLFVNELRKKKIFAKTCLIIAMYECESWTIEEEVRKRLEVLEMCYRRMLKIIVNGWIELHMWKYLKKIREKRTV